MGAEVLVAIDIDCLKEYDWGWDGSPDDFNTEGGTSNWTDAGAGFYELSRILGSKAKREHKSIYDLAPKGDGLFVLKFNFGFSYHLRHPLPAWATTRAVFRGAMFRGTHGVNAWGILPGMGRAHA